MILSRLDRTLLGCARGPLLKPGEDESGGGKNDDSSSGDENGNRTEKRGESSDKSKVEFTPEQQAEVDRIAAAARKDGEKSGKTKAEAEYQTAQDEAERKRQQDADKARGDFEKVETDLRNEIATLKTDLKAATERRDALQSAIETILTSEWDELPEEVRDAYVGDENDALAKLAYLPKARKLAERLGGEQDRSERRTTHANPRGTRDSNGFDPAKERAAMGRSGQYSM